MSDSVGDFSTVSGGQGRNSPPLQGSQGLHGSDRDTARIRATQVSRSVEMEVPVDIQYLFDEEQRQAQAVQQERQKVLHCEAMLQHAQTFVDEHLRQQEEQMWLRQLATEQMMYEAVERERQMVAQAFRQAQQQQEAAVRDGQVAHSAVDTILAELHHARDQAEVWQSNTRMQYQKLQEVSEEYQSLHQKHILLEREAAALKAVTDRQKAELHGLWRQEEQASSIIRSFSPQQRDSVRLVQTLRDELRDSQYEFWLRIFADANMTGLSWMPRARCCWNAQPNKRKKSYVCVWSLTGERASYADRPQLLGLEDVMLLLAQYRASMDQTDLSIEMISAPSTRLMTGAGRRITLLPHL